MSTIVKRLTNHKAPGPDNSTTELYKILTIDNIPSITSLLNKFWAQEEFPETFTEANIASIFKKGDTQNLANYRPISLLNTLYESVATIIHDRIASKIDSFIMNTQYGFRKGKSTAHALYIEDLAEQSGDNIVLVLLDWEKHLINSAKKECVKP